MEEFTDDKLDTQLDVKNEETVDEKKLTEFKKPILIGKIGKFPKKVTSYTKNVGTTKLTNVSTEEQKIVDVPIVPIEHRLPPTEVTASAQDQPIKAPAQQLQENSIPLPYKEPAWSGLPHSKKVPYKFEVLKSGIIVDQIDLMSKPFWVFGRATNCEIYMAHPTISRYHAVLQYRSDANENNLPGFYVYDLNSTHGTFLNKGRLKPRVYAPVKVGHMIKLGFSSRSYILTGPEEDAEEESEFSITELKQQRAEKLLAQKLEEKEASLRKEQEKEEKRKREEERGIDWGLGEDAEEETDLIENPYAQPNNEELYLDDPKKALRGFMEREGYDLEYDCTEQGFGQFLCKVELPVDDDFGRPVVAEVLHRGKKKEAVIQCALEACRILDRHGLLRQATHESRKRKVKNWEEDDYYDSDDDTFLDRTGIIEKKREKRMKSKLPQHPETYQSLVEKEKRINQEITRIEHELSKGNRPDYYKSSNVEEDSLDSFMKELTDSKPDKHTISKLKSELVDLKTEHVKLIKLVNLTKPAGLPPLVIHEGTKSQESTSQTGKSNKNFPMIGKRLKTKLTLPLKPLDVCKDAMEIEQIEEDQKERDSTNSNNTSTSVIPSEGSSKPIENINRLLSNVEVHRKLIEFEKLILKQYFPPVLQSYFTDMKDLIQKFKEIVEDDGKIQSECKTIQAKNIKLKSHVENLQRNNESDLKRIVTQLRSIFSEIQDATAKQEGLYNKLRILDTKIDLFCKDFLKKIDEISRNKSSKKIPEAEDEDNDDFEEDDENIKEFTPEELERRKKKNQRRILQRKEKAEKEKQKGYQEDARKQDYNMWVPPKDQTGDGRTSLNEKFGY